MEDMGTETRKQRNYGIDLLRMIAMLMVVILHILGKGGVLQAAPPLSIRYETAWLLETAAYCAVDCYALISGYVGFGTRCRYADLAALWLRVVFYTVTITAVFALVLPGSVSAGEWLRAIFPVVFNQYWYFTAYFCLFLFLPLINAAVNGLKREELRRLVLALVAFLSVLPTVLRRDTFGLQGGYGPLWLITVYVIGAYLGKYDALRKITPQKALLGYGTVVGVSWLVKLGADHGMLSFFGESSGVLISYTSPTILGAGIFLLALFRGLRLPLWLQKLVAAASPLAFSVYLIHAQPLVWKYIITDGFTAFAGRSAPLLLLGVLGTALTIYVFCSLIDLLRADLFSRLRVRDRLRNLEDRITGSARSH